MLSKARKPKDPRDNKTASSVLTTLDLCNKLPQIRSSFVTKSLNKINFRIEQHIDQKCVKKSIQIHQR